MTGGTINGSGSFVMEARRVGKETLLAQIVAMVSEAQRSRAAIQRLADTVFGFFVPAVIAIAAVTALIWGIWGPDLRGIVRARRLSMQVMRKIKQNLFFALVYNALGVPMAAGVAYPIVGPLLSPMVASAAMALSSVSVIANALRLRRSVLDETTSRSGRGLGPLFDVASVRCRAEVTPPRLHPSTSSDSSANGPSE